MPNDRRLRDAGILIRPLELDQIVHVQAGIVPLPSFFDIGTHYDPGGIHAFHHARSPGLHDIAGISRDHRFHPGTNQRRLGLEQRHRLALHVGSHQRTVRIVVFQERHKGRRHTHYLLRRHIHVFDLVRSNGDKISAGSRRHRFRHQPPEPSSFELAWAMMYLSPSIAERNSI